VGKIKIILGLAVFALIVSTGWQIADCELANYEFKDELRDVASLNGAKIGLAAQQTDEDLRATVIRKAAGHDIVLQPVQVLVRRSGTEENPKVFLAAKYQERIWMPGIYLIVHFSVSSGG
jgi:hypothetical protein